MVIDGYDLQTIYIDLQTSILHNHAAVHYYSEKVHIKHIHRSYISGAHKKLILGTKAEIDSGF